MSTEKSVMLAAGGTGGHLFPAYALAEELRRRSLIVDLVTDHRGDRYGTDFPGRDVHQVPSATVAGKSPLALARTGLTLARGLVAARALLKRVKPGVIVGFGGYPTFPPLLAGAQLGIPTALHEQNAVLGRANKFLAKRVTAVATSFEKVKLLDPSLASKVRLTGNPVRDAVIAMANVPYPALAPDGPLHLLVFGGSQGARYFSDSVPPVIANLAPPLRSRLRVVQQARPEDMERVRAAYETAGVNANVEAFFKNLPEIMAQSHLVIGRSGASTVAELSVVGRPAILVPLPHALDNDQLQNATRLAEAGGAWCIEQKDLSAQRLASELERLFGNPAGLIQAAQGAKSQGRPDAVKKLADLVQSLM